MTLIEYTTQHKIYTQVKELLKNSIIKVSEDMTSFGYNIYIKNGEVEKIIYLPSDKINENGKIDDDFLTNYFN